MNSHVHCYFYGEGDIFNLIYFLAVLCFFPFIQIVDIGTDTQPYAAIFSIFIILFSRFRFNKKNMLMGLIVVCAIFLFLISDNKSFLELRSLFNYISIFLISTATYIGLKRKEGIKEKFIKRIINVWFLVGFIQAYIKRDFMFGVIAGARTSLSRGVPAFNSEPSFYAFMLMFAFLIVLDFKKNRLLYIVNICVQLILFAQSSIGIGYLVIYLGLLAVKYLNYLKIKYPKGLLKVVGLLFVVFFIISIIPNLFPDSRLGNILNQALVEPMSLYYRDYSVNSRVNHIINPILASINNALIPFGYSNSVIMVGYNRIMSGFGATIFELGFLGIVLIGSIIKSIYDAKFHFNHIVNSFFILIIMFSAIQLASPLLAFYIGYCQYSKNKLPLKSI